MNKTLLFIIFAVLAGVGLVLYALILLFAPEHAPAFAGQVIVVLGLVSASATTFYMLGKQQTTLEEVKTNTNGKLSALMATNDAKDATIADLQRKLLQVVQAAPSADQ